MAKLKVGDFISVVEENTIKGSSSKKECQQTTIKVLKDFEGSIEELFKEQGRTNESLVRFLVRVGFGRIIIPKGTIVFNGDDGSITHDL